MPGKSRRGRGKYGKKKKDRLGPSPIVAQQQAVTHPTVPAPSARVLTPVATPRAIQHPYIVTELRRIGILSGIIVAILVVLALVLS